MERSRRVSSSAAQPASKKMALDIDPSGGASGSAARPATLLEQVEQLGHYPKRCKEPVTDRERTENSLAEKIAKQWSKLDEANKAELARLQKDRRSLIVFSSTRASRKYEILSTMSSRGVVDSTGFMPYAGKLVLPTTPDQCSRKCHL